MFKLLLILFQYKEQQETGTSLVWWTSELPRCASSQKLERQYYAVRRLHFSFSSVKREDVFKHLALAFCQDLCSAIALLGPVIAPCFSFVRTGWHGLCWSLCRSAKGTVLTAIFSKAKTAAGGLTFILSPCPSLHLIPCSQIYQQGNYPRSRLRGFYYWYYLGTCAIYLSLHGPTILNCGRRRKRSLYVWVSDVSTAAKKCNMKFYSLPVSLCH